MKKMFSIPFAAIVMLAITLSSCSSDNPNAAFINSKGCVECDKYAIGDMFTIDGVTYTVADRKMLDNALNNGEHLTKYCTSKVTDMSGLFMADKYFNQYIDNWDVSSMSTMFHATPFNQDIGNWDVSNVIEMREMFRDAASFNQDLSQWCVSKIPHNMGYFSEYSSLSPENHPVWGTCP